MASKWEYNKYRATLTKDGKFFALVTPDGKNSLSDKDSSELLSELNKKPEYISTEEESYGFGMMG